jgi:hypothetical protein
VWYTDSNALVRQKVDAAVIQQRTPWIAEIVRQGIREGAFTAFHPDQTAEVILYLLYGMGNSHARLLFEIEQGSREPGYVEKIVAIHAAYMEAIERVLGAPPNSLVRTTAAAVNVWVTALQEHKD